MALLKEPKQVAIHSNGIEVNCNEILICVYVTNACKENIFPQILTDLTRICKF